MRKLKIFLFFLFSFGLGVIAHKYGGRILAKFKGGAPVVEDASRLSSEELKLDTIRIHIPDSAYSILQGNRTEAIKNGILSKEYRDEVKGFLISENDTNKIQLRLKGDLSDHWSDPLKWSFRIKIKKKRAFQGINTFNFQKPETRGNLNEWFFHKLLECHELISLRYKFVKAYVNDQDLGIYALEEYFDKRLIENNLQRVGVTFRFNTSKYWHHKHGTDPNRLFGCPIEPFKIGKKEKDNPLYNQFLIAKGMVESWVAGQVSIEKVFDIEKLATYLAIVDLTGHQHASAIDNMKFYYNPVTSLIEPIGYDNSVIKPLSRESILAQRSLLGERRALATKNVVSGDLDWYDRVFSNEIFYKKYITALNRVSNAEGITDLTASLSGEIVRNEQLIQMNNSKYQFEGVEVITKNAAFIRSFLTPIGGVESFISSKDTLTGKTELQVRNVHYAPFLVEAILYKDSVLHKFDAPILLQSNNHSRNSDVSFEVNLDTSLLKKKKFEKRLKIRYSMLGAQETFTSSPYAWEENSANAIESIISSRNPDYSKFSFAQVTEDKVILAGRCQINELFTIDKSKQLIVEPSTQIILGKGGAILCYGGVQMNGTPDRTIEVVALEGGQGLAAINCKSRSSIMHTNFNGLSHLQIQHWKLPSAVTFYNSDVDIQFASFKENKIGDDYLNIFRSEFTLSDSKFIDTKADAFDGDFVSGTITNVSFQNIGNDGIDFSGSTIQVSNSVFNNVSDKAISGGERSYITARNVKISNCELGINSKDDSHVYIFNSTIEGTRVPYVVFMKKPEYGPGYINATAVSIAGEEKVYLLEEKSFLYIDQKLQESTSANVKELLYGGQFGRSSK